MTVGDQTQSSAGAGVAAPALMPGDPRRIGGVGLLGRLGEGGMGTVYLGRMAAPDGRANERLVAVKVIRADYARDERFRARFRAEARAAQRVARFCTAQVLDVGLDDDIAYLVTEFIDGPTLTAAVSREGPLHGSLLDSLAIGVAAALNGIHAAGVVHRDLKPSNVILSRVGPKVIDFGIARAPDNPETLTDSGHIVGTPAYMAPEQFSGTATAASDVFSWGAVIAYAATGHAPFRSGTPFELMRRVTEDEPDLSGIDRPLRDLVARALDKRPERRPTARALLLELVDDRQDPLGASSRILATTWAATKVEMPPTKVDQPQGNDKRKWTAVGVTLAAVVAAVAYAANLPDGDPEKPNTQASNSPSAPVQQSRQSERPQQGGGFQTISVGERVQQKTLKVGEVDTYRFTVTTARAVFVQGFECSNLVPWTLSTVGGGPVANGSMSCHSEGPFALTKGEYELKLGGPGTEGKYAFQLASG